MIVKRLSFTCINILGQLENAITKVSSRDFVRPSIALGGSSIGQHIRHTLEFFVCLESGFDRGVVNYDNRAHDKLIEKDKTRALATLEGIRNFIIINNSDNKSLILEGIYDQDSTEVYTIGTNFYRELAYNIEHAIHHMAMIKIGINEVAPYVKLPAGFGVAASTIRYAAVST